jgi:acetyl-CoA C-acetyltransferase
MYYQPKRSTMNIHIIGASTTKFGELWGVSPRTLASQAVNGAMKDAGINSNRIDALFVGNMLSGMLGGQEHLGAFFAEELGLQVPAFKIEGACASGGLAAHNAVNSVLSGQYETVVVLGVEKMTDHKPEDVATALMGGSESGRNHVPRIVCNSCRYAYEIIWYNSGTNCFRCRKKPCARLLKSQCAIP